MKMYGLRIYDAQGTVVLDVSDRTPRILGSFTIPAIKSKRTVTGQVKHEGLRGRTALWWLELAKPASAAHQYDYSIHQDNDTLIWSITVNRLLYRGQVPPLLVHYGVY